MFKGLFTLSSLLIPIVSGAHEVEVFFKHNQPDRQTVSGSVITYVDVAAVESLEEVISQDLSLDSTKALQQINEFMNSSEGRIWVGDLKNAARGVAKAYQYGIKGVPAIVIDGRYVIYGTSDVKLALSQYNGEARNEQ
ncbi:TIGR03757 family integrating conjugative element protein [Vibrio fluvialis]|nr:TIGR03757 family integrating conjugative element protein [Vibrio fluvialis]